MFEVSLSEQEEKEEFTQQRFLEEQRRKKVDEQERLRQEAENLFDSAEEKAFYEDFPDLKSKLPSAVFGNNYFQPISAVSKANEEESEAMIDDILLPDDEEEEEEQDEKKDIVIAKVEDEDDNYGKPSLLVSMIKLIYLLAYYDEPKDETPRTYDQFKRTLSHCVSSETADYLSE